MQNLEFDLFISHASEVKIEFVEPLANELKRMGLKVWYDKAFIGNGDSLRQKIDYGISASKYAVIVFSKNYFRNRWTTAELDAIFSQERSLGKRIIPIIYDVNIKYISENTPLLSAKLAIEKKNKTINEIAQIIYNDIQNESLKKG